MSKTMAASPAITAAVGTRIAGSRDSKTPRARLVAAKLRMPLPASCQLKATTGASML